jgi:ABC-type sugar transport system substrate-binding protein
MTTRPLAALCLAVLLLTVLAGCTTKTPEETGKTAVQPAEQKTETGPSPAIGTPKPEDLLPSGKGVKVAMIPKIKGIDYFNATQRGAEEAAKALGVELVFDGPMESSVDKQIEMIDSFITRKFDVIAVSPNDPDAVAPVLKRARDQGLHVITWDADANPQTSGREFFINQASPESIGRTLVDVMAKEAGEDAKTVIVTGTLTAANQNEWMKWMKQRMKDKYPKMQVLATKPSEEDQQLARQVTQDVLTAYKDLDGIFAITSVAFPGAATALEKSDRAGKVALTGLSSPSTMRKWVENGTVKTVVLWNPVDLGYLTIFAAKALAVGALKPGASGLEAGRLGKKQVEKDQVLLGDPMLFAKENIGKYDF